MIMPFPYRDQRQAFPTWVHGNVGMGSSRRKGEGDNGICWKKISPIFVLE